MPAEHIFFHKGLAFDSRSALQQPGYLQTADNVTFAYDGKQGRRPSFNIVVGDEEITGGVNVHSVKRFRSHILKASRAYLFDHEGGSVLGGDYSTPLCFAEYKDFLHIANGAHDFLYDANGSLYPAKVPNPTGTPVGADSGVAGSPSGVYKLYVTFLITWPNGMTYETGFSTGSDDVTVDSKDISWSSVPTSDYDKLHGTSPTIYRKLYIGPGTGGTLADIYYWKTLTNNSATTVTYGKTDAQMAAASASVCDDYDVGPSNALFVAYHYGRCFKIDKDYLHRLWYSQAAAGTTSEENENRMPLGMEDNDWDDIRTAAMGPVDPQGIIGWGTNLYVPMKHTWLRKVGNDPDTWEYKKTYSNIGVAAPRSIAIASQVGGILAVSTPKGKTPGLALFNGSTSEVVTSPFFDYIFEEDLNRDFIHNCSGAFDGRYYHWLYPSGDNVMPDKWAAFDMSRFPEIRLAFWTGTQAHSIEAYDQGEQIYIGCADGYIRENQGRVEGVDIDIETHDLIGAPEAANTLKTLKQLKYNLDTNGEDVTLEVYLDGTLAKWPDGATTKSISGTGDAVQYIKSLPQGWEAYTYSIRVYGSAVKVFELYSPWEVEFDV